MTKQKNLPDTLNQDQFMRIYRGELERHSDELISEIKQVLAITPNQDVTSAHLVVFPDEYGDGYATVSMYFDGKNKKIDNADKSIFPGRHISFVEYVRDLPLVDVMAYEERFPMRDLTVDMVKQWVAECWWKAGGWNYPLNVEIFAGEGFGKSESILLSKGI